VQWFWFSVLTLEISVLMSEIQDFNSEIEAFYLLQSTHQYSYFLAPLTYVKSTENTTFTA